MDFWNPHTERGPFLKCSVRSRCRDFKTNSATSGYQGCPAALSSTPVQRLPLFHPNPEENKVAQKTSQMPSKTAPLQNHSALSIKVKSYITIMLVPKRQVRPFAALSFLCNPFNPWFLCWSAFHHTLIAVNLNFSLNISSSNSFGFLTVPKVRLAPQACISISEKACTLTASFVACHLASPAPVLCWKIAAGFTPLT